MQIEYNLHPAIRKAKTRVTKADDASHAKQRRIRLDQTIPAVRIHYTPTNISPYIHTAKGVLPSAIT
jgi:hypothetical protein